MEQEHLFYFRGFGRLLGFLGPLGVEEYWKGSRLAEPGVLLALYS
jgi:hypothetical protein